MEIKEILQHCKKHPEYASFAIYDVETIKRLHHLMKEGYLIVKSGLAGTWAGGCNQWGDDCWVELTAKGVRYYDTLK
jgi:hypothetical protein